VKGAALVVEWQLLLGICEAENTGFFELWDP